jgi:hypothetical protein
MAPEQADLNAIPDARWDVYALGALLYHMLCGTPPFRTPENERRIREATNLEEKLTTYRQIVGQGPRPARHRSVRGVDARLAEIVDRCLAPDPSRRYRDAAEVADALATRARQRSLKPMIWLGIALPGLLLVLLFPLAMKAVDNAAATAERNIAKRALESGGVSAKILAYSLNDDIDQRLRALANIADYAELKPRLAGITQPVGSPARSALQEYLAADKAHIDQIRRESDSDLDESWFLNDAEGFQRWREPPSPRSEEQNYSWRDYFHGQGADHPEWEGRKDIPPLTTPHISAPYRSVADGELKIALTVPVHDAEQRVIGVLGRTVQLGKLLGSYKRLLGDEWRDQAGERVIALYDTRGDRGWILDHPWMTAANLGKLAGAEVFDRPTLPAEQRQMLEELRKLVRTKQPTEGRNLVLRYDDPVANVDADAKRKFGMPWLAAFWPVGDTGWFAVVQERRDEVLSPVREIQGGLVKYGLTGVLLVVTLVATSWYFIRRVMRGQERKVPEWKSKRVEELKG